MNTRNQAQHYLRRHAKYVDYRIQLINNYVTSFASTDDDFSDRLISFMITGNDKEITGILDTELETPVRELKQLVSKWNIMQEGDILGYIYQGLQSHISKKHKGQFFTPGDIVTHLASSSLALASSWLDLRILDPACGSGQFLITLYGLLLERYRAEGMDEGEASDRIIRHHLNGFDTDRTAIRIARYNLSRISGIEEEAVNIHCINFLIDEQGPVADESVPQFDLIIGNPPWGSRVTAEEKTYFRKHYVSSSSGINTFTLFLEKSLARLRHGGLVSFLIPEAYLNIKAHQSSRKLMLDCTAIGEITIWGERFRGVFAPSISIIARLEYDAAERTKNIVSILHGSDLESGTSILIPQASYLRTPEHILNINYTRKCVNLISTMESHDCLYLKDHTRFFLGIVTGNNTRHIYNFKSEDHPDPIILGKDLRPYKINFSHHYFRYNPGTLQQVAPQHLYQAKDKIMYKFIGKRLTFALDRSGYYSLNNVNGFIPDRSCREQLNIETILAILNSDLMQYYYEKNYFTLKVLRGNLERLPLKKISSLSQKRLKQLAELVMTSGGEAEKKYRRNIEDIIFHEYGIKDRDAYLITSHERSDDDMSDTEPDSSDTSTPFIESAQPRA